MNKTERVIQVSLRVYGDELEPQKITQILSVEPTKAKRKDEITYLNHGREVRSKTGLWRLDVDNRFSTVEKKINFIIDLLTPSITTIHEDCFAESIVIDVTLGVSGDAESIEYKIKPEDFVRLTNLNISLSLTVL